MRYVLVAIAVSWMVAWCSPARAIVQEASLTITDSGVPVPEATVTLTITAPEPPQPGEAEAPPAAEADVPAGGLQAEAPPEPIEAEAPRVAEADVPGPPAQGESPPEAAQPEAPAPAETEVEPEAPPRPAEVGAPAAPAPARERRQPAPVQRVAVTADETGTVRFRYDDATIHENARVDVTVVTPEGRSRTIRNLPFAALIRAGQLDIPGLRPPPSLAGPPLSPVAPPPFTGFYVGGQVGHSFGSQEVSETALVSGAKPPPEDFPEGPPEELFPEVPPEGISDLSVEEAAAVHAPGVVRSRRSHSSDATGGGVTGGLNIALGRNVVGGPFVALEFPNQNTRSVAGSGAHLAIESDLGIAAGVQVGLVTEIAQTPTLLYALAGGKLQRHDLEIAGPAAASDRQTLLGGTLGVGIAVQPRALRPAGIPAAIFVQYEHTWWEDSDPIRAASAPGSTFIFGGDDDRIKFGITFFLNARR